MPRKPAPPSADSAEALAAILADVKSVCAKLSAFVAKTPPLTGKDRMRSTKFARGAKPMVLQIASLADRVGLAMPGRPTADMLAQVQFADDLFPLYNELSMALKSVDDTIFLHRSQSWSSATVYYSALRRLSKEDGAVAETLQPVTQFFAKHGRRGEAAAKNRKKKAKPAPTEKA